MNINYYKQPQSNDFILFTKRPGRVRRILVIVLLALFVVSAFGIWKLKHHSKQTQVATQETPVPVPTTVAADIPFTVDSLNSSLSDTYSEKVFGIKNKAKPAYAANDSHTQTVAIKSRDTLGKIFSRLGISKKELHAILKSGDDAALLKNLTPGKELVLKLDDAHHVKQLSYAANLTDTVNVQRRGPNSFTCRLDTKPLETKQEFAEFTIRGSVAESGKKAGLSNKQLATLTSIFKSSVDVNKGKHNGDKVCVLYQDYYFNNKKVRDGEIVAAEYKTATNTYQAVRFTDPKGNSGYYAPDGSSMQKRFLPAPLKFTRISSLFNPKRWHPVLHRFRHHQGVDYAAPYGTPIKSVASGVIALKGRKGGYGNTIMIKHDSSYSTLYGHLSRYAQNIQVGSHVQQGQVIGYVGASGLATGPHLHFEFRINGVHKNPLTVALPNGKSITRAYRDKFHLLAKKLLAKLDHHKVDS